MSSTHITRVKSNKPVAATWYPSKMHLAISLGIVIYLLVTLSPRLPFQVQADAFAQSSNTITFAAIGDFGEDNSDHTRVARLIKSWNPDLIITMGDNRYGNSTFDDVIGKRYCDYLKDVQPGPHCNGGKARDNRFFPSIGNHDYDDGKGINEYLRYFSLPGNERYYDFVKGPVHFFAINSDNREPDGFKPSSAQAAWLQAALSASNAAWKVVYFHHTPYSSGSRHGNDSDRQWPFAQWGADVVIAGHDHLYERIERDCIVYFVNGLGGRSRYHFGRPIRGSAKRYRSHYGAMRVTATATQMELTFRSLSGFTDRTILRKGPSQGLTRLRNVAYNRYLQETSNTNVRTSSSSHGNDRLWEIIDNGNRAVLLQNMKSGRYLDYDRNNVDTSSSPSADDEWKLIPDGDRFLVCNLSTGRYLDADRSNNYNVDTSSSPTKDDIWELVPDQPVEVLVRNVYYGRYLQEESNRNVRTSSSGKGADRRWRILDNGDGSVLFQNVRSGRYLDYDANNVDTSSSPSADDKWKLIPSGNINFIHNIFSGHYLDADRSNNYNVDTSSSPTKDDEWEVIPVN